MGVVIFDPHIIKKSSSQYFILAPLLFPDPSQPLLNTKEKLEEKLNSLIRTVVASKDELAHVTLFNWMISMGFEKKLVSLDSPFLESFLVREIRDQTAARQHRIYYDLLWRHYDYRKDYVNAAKVLTALAEKYCGGEVIASSASASSAMPTPPPPPHITLKERVEYLTQAIVALNSSASSKTPVKDELAELADKKDVALLQERIYEQLRRVDAAQRNECVQEALAQLDSQLYDITRLYYEFAEKFDLFECMLCILKTARHEDARTVELLWKQIIASELDKWTRPDVKPSDTKSLLAESLAAIAREYVEEGEAADKYFPLSVIIDSLEFVSLSRGFEPEWACTLLLRKLALPFDQLIHAYNAVHLRKDIKWAENASRFLNAIYCLVEMFTRAPNATNDTDK